MCLESCPIETAANSDATRAKSTESGAPPPLNAIPAGMENAVAIAGAMNVMLLEEHPAEADGAPAQSSGSVFTSDVGHGALPRRSGLECYAVRL